MENAKETTPEIQKLGEQIVNLKIKEVQELLDYLKDVHGIEPAAAPAQVVAGPSAAPQEAEEKEEKTIFTVMLKSAGSNKINVIKAIRKITLGCEPFEVSEDELSSRPIVEEDIQFVTSGSSDYSFSEEISFPTISVSESELSFGQLAEEDNEKTLSFSITNTGQEAISGSISIRNNAQSAYQLSQSAVVSL